MITPFLGDDVNSVLPVEVNYSRTYKVVVVVDWDDQ